MYALKRRAAVILSLSIFVIFVVVYFFASTRTFCAALVADEVVNAFRAIGGYELKFDDLQGNPLTGVNAAGIHVALGGIELVSADSIEMRLDLMSLLSSPRLSRMSIYGLTADLDTVLSHLPQEKKASSGPPALKRLTLHDSKISTLYGEANMKDMTLLLSEEDYRIDLHGAYQTQPLSVQAHLRNSEGEMSLREFAMEWNGMEFEANGSVTPSLDLVCHASNVDANEFSDILMQLKSVDVQGLYSAEVRVQDEGAFSATGTIRSEKGQVDSFSFDDLRTDFHYTNREIEIRNLSARLFDGAVSADVRVSLALESPPVVSLDLVAQDLDVNGVQAVFPQLKQIVGRIDASCRISGGIDNLNGEIHLNTENIEAYGFEVTQASADIRFSDPKMLALSFGGNAFGADVWGGGNIRLQPETDLHLEVDVSKLSLETLADRFPQIGEAGARGLAVMHVKIRGPVDAPVVDGALSFSSMTVLKEHELKDVAVEFSYDKQGLSLTAAKATFNDAMITAEGHYSADGVGNLDFKGFASNVKLENFSNLVPTIGKNNFQGTVSGAWSLGGTTAAPRAHFALTAPTFSLLKRFVLSNITAEANVADGLIEVVNVSAEMGSTSASAEGEIVLPTGSLPASYNIKGSFDDLNPVDFVKMGLVSADISGDLAGDFRVWSEDGKEPSVRVFFKDSRVVYSNLFDISGLAGAITWDDGNLRLDRLRTMVNKGYASVTGTVGNVTGRAFSPGNTPLDLEVSVSSADIGRISRFFKPNSKGYQGILTASLDVEGTAADPRFKGDASLSGVRAFGLFFPIVQVNDVTGDLKEIQFPHVRAIVGRGIIDGHGVLQKTTDWNASLEATGRSVDIRSLTFSLEREMRREFSGTLNFDFKGAGWLDSFEGGGEIRIPLLNAMGIKITDFSAPFWVNEGFVLIEDSTAKGYGGEIRAQIAKDLNLSNWGGRVEVLSADFASLLRDLMPESEGSITGSADLSLRLQGDSARTSMQDGSGNFVIRNGEITGFPGIEAISRATGGKPLRFASAAFPFSIDGKTLYLLPGTRISAPNDDPVFHYVMVDGSIVIEEKKISMSCIGNVNVRALNSFMGGLQGLVSAAMSDMGNTDALLQNFLGGALSGFSRNEFRDVSLVVDGIPGDLHFEHIEIAQPMTYDTRPEVLNQTVDEREKMDEERFRLSVEIPVGPGGGHASNLGGQVGGQIFEQAIKSLFSF